MSDADTGDPCHGRSKHAAVSVRPRSCEETLTAGLRVAAATTSPGPPAATVPYHRSMVPEAPLEETETGLVPVGDGWFVLNAREARWRERPQRGFSLPFEGPTDFPQIGVNLFVLGPGEPIGMYHWEANQEDFLVLSGEALLLVEGEERPLGAWDLVHCPPGTNHIIVGAGDAPCVVVAVGAREHGDEQTWGGYTVDELALRHGSGVEQETSDAGEAYARFPEPFFTRYRDGWLPD
jgi:uncharacterized cupin superfamily protein